MYNRLRQNKIVKRAADSWIGRKLVGGSGIAEIFVGDFYLADYVKSRQYGHSQESELVFVAADLLIGGLLLHKYIKGGGLEKFVGKIYPARP